MINKKTFQQDAYRPLQTIATRCQLGERRAVQWSTMFGRGLNSQVPCRGETFTVRSPCLGNPVQWGPMLHGWWSHGTPLDRQTDRTENITFPQLRWRAVTIHQWNGCLEKGARPNFSLLIHVESFVTICFTRSPLWHFMPLSAMFTFSQWLYHAEMVVCVTYDSNVGWLEFSHFLKCVASGVCATNPL